MSEYKQPNILLILNDDMGFSDLGCYGGEIHSPNLDRLAYGGLRFTQFYNTARCCPSRASLLTGLHPHQTGVGHMMTDDGLEGYRGDLNHNCVTIADVTKAVGYDTYMSGKWHISRHIGPDGPKHSWPLQRGFDHFYGIITGAANFWRPRTLTHNNEQLDLEDLPDDYFFTDAISDKAVEQICLHQETKPNNPFFSYVAYTAPHWPLHAHQEDIDKYLGRFDRGWDILRQQRLQRMRQMSLLDETWEMSGRDPSQLPWEQAEFKEWNCRRMEVYSAQVDRMDQGIGRIIKALEDTRQLENTIIMFLADNGGCAEELGGPPEPGSARVRESDTDISTFLTSDGQPIYHGNDPNIMPGPETTYQSYGVPWANLSNTPFREYKHWVHEGGIGTPLIVHWPAGISARGEIRHQPAQLTDIMATCLEVSSAKYPTEHKGHKIQPLQGDSLVPIFDNQDNGKEVLYWEHEGNRAVRKGRWKLVSKYPGNWELYDIEKDRTELNDLSPQYPKVVTELLSLYDDWADLCSVESWDDITTSRKSRRAN